MVHYFAGPTGGLSLSLPFITEQLGNTGVHCLTLPRLSKTSDLNVFWNIFKNIFFLSLQRHTRWVFSLLFSSHNWIQNEWNVYSGRKCELCCDECNTLSLWRSVKTQVTPRSDAAFICRARLTFPKLFSVKSSNLSIVFFLNLTPFTDSLWNLHPCFLIYQDGPKMV